MPYIQSDILPVVIELKYSQGYIFRLSKDASIFLKKVDSHTKDWAFICTSLVLCKYTKLVSGPGLSRTICNKIFQSRKTYTICLHIETQPFSTRHRVGRLPWAWISVICINTNTDDNGLWDRWLFLKYSKHVGSLQGFIRNTHSHENHEITKSKINHWVSFQVRIRWGLFSVMFPSLSHTY